MIIGKKKTTATATENRPRIKILENYLKENNLLESIT
jgi:hypothetical protein